MSAESDKSSLSGRNAPPAEGATAGLDLSVIIPALNEGPNLEVLLPELRRTLTATVDHWEILIVTREPDELTMRAADKNGARVLVQSEPGYGGALVKGLAEARGTYTLTMDADLSHPPVVVADLWAARLNSDLTVASRYVPGGKADMPVIRYVLSRILNGVFRIGFGMKIHDLSSGFRIYRREVISTMPLASRDFDILQEILIKSRSDGRSLGEIPFSYKPRRHGHSNARLFRFGLAYLRTLRSLRKLGSSAGIPE